MPSAFDPLPNQVPAGGFSRVTNKGGVSDLFTSPSEYGASLSAFNTWKKYGIATSQQQQTSSFGCKTQFGLSGERGGKKLTTSDPRHSARNPISWEGADVMSRQDEHNRSTLGIKAPPLGASGGLDGAPARASGILPGAPAAESASAQWAASQSGPTTKRLKEEQMHQTWGELMRNGALQKQSAATAMVESSYLPKGYSSAFRGEGPPKGSAMGSSMHSIGLGTQTGKFANNKVSSKFTSEFNDPYL